MSNVQLVIGGQTYILVGDVILQEWVVVSVILASIPLLLALLLLGFFLGLGLSCLCGLLRTLRHLFSFLIDCRLLN